MEFEPTIFRISSEEIQRAQLEFGSDIFDQEFCFDEKIPASMRSFANSRKWKFFLGRLCIAKAFESLGVDPLPVVGIEPSGAPDWPVGWMGSVTHTKSFASCAIGSEKSYPAIGVDAETWVPKSVSDRISPRVCTRSEIEILKGELPSNEAITLLFSAKESIWKMLNPWKGIQFGFLDVSLVGYEGTDRLDFEVKSFGRVSVSFRKLNWGVESLCVRRSSEERSRE